MEVFLRNLKYEIYKLKYDLEYIHLRIIYFLKTKLDFPYF